jgi:hypothetical protein
MEQMPVEQRIAELSSKLNNILDTEIGEGAVSMLDFNDYKELMRLLGINPLDPDERMRRLRKQYGIDAIEQMLNDAPTTKDAMADFLRNRRR